MQKETKGEKTGIRPAVILAAMGVVFGDIGTSPLYAFKECVAHATSHGSALNESVYGILSLIVWSLILLVWVKYINLVLRADNEGEGGILALLNLAFPQGTSLIKGSTKYVWHLTVIGLLGAALLYGDGVITPAISVLSAVEGLTLISPSFTPWIIPAAVAILIGLFSIQNKGTSSIGRYFGPIILVWFVVLGTLGLAQITQTPTIFRAFNPLVGINFLTHHPAMAFAILGSVLLVVTGGESLYADMGHFGRQPIRLAWDFVVLPSLLLNYLGQGALVLRKPETAGNPLFLLAPDWGLIPLVILAMLATIIASQALISGVFSLTTAAVQMVYLPRMQILHTNHEESGQIYIPVINKALAGGCIALVLVFQSSSGLAAAYGVGVVLTMLATTSLFFFVAHKRWGWPLWKAGAICGLIGALELVFTASNLLKIANGGWVPIAIGLSVFTMMATWKRGRNYIRGKTALGLNLPSFVDSISLSGVLDPKWQPHRVTGTAVFLSGTPDITPTPLIYNLTHNHILHEQNIVLTVVTTKIPIVPDEKRIEVTRLPAGFLQVTAKYGFMQVPTIQSIEEAMKAKNIMIDEEHTTFFLGRETLIPSEKGLNKWQETLFRLMSRNAQNAAQFFRLPCNRTIEIGHQIEI